MLFRKLRAISVKMLNFAVKCLIVAYVLCYRIATLWIIRTKLWPNFTKAKRFHSNRVYRFSCMGPPDLNIKAHSLVLRPEPALRSPICIHVQSHSPLSITTQMTVCFWSEENLLTLVGLDERYTK
jgi:uncharacterized membrane protein